MADHYNGRAGVKITGPDLESLHKAMKSLADQEVLVGIPEDKTERDGEEITNATIGYINEFGMPEHNIPARGWLVPGIRKNVDKLGKLMFQLGKRVRPGFTPEQVNQGLNIVGIAAVNGIRAGIQDGIPPPLADATIEARAARGRKGAIQEIANRAAGSQPSTELAKPLIDTGLFLKAITYVVVRRRKG